MDSFTPALEHLTVSNSLKYSHLGTPSIERAYAAFAANSDLCLSFLRRCVDYGEKVIGWGLSSIPLPAPFRVMASHELWERPVKLRTEVTHA